MSKKVPEHPITDEERAEFKRLIPIWQKRLHLGNWRIFVGRKRPANCLAEVEVKPADRLALIHVGRDWGSDAPFEGELEETVIHELLHVLLYDLATLAEEADEEKAGAFEHAAIVPLAKALLKLSQECTGTKKT